MIQIIIQCSIQNIYILYITVNIQMISMAEDYRQLIQDATKKIMLFPRKDNQSKQSTATLWCDIKLPSLHPFKSSQQIDKDIPTVKQITHQLSQYYRTSQYNHLPDSSIGLILCEHRQNNQIYYIYSTGILIHKSLVFTSAQDVYCRRLNKQYINIRFIVGVNGDKCSGIYDVIRVHYPNEYTILQEYENYDFAVLQLYDDLSKSCGYVGLKSVDNIQANEKVIKYEYHYNQEGYFKLGQVIKNQKSQYDLEYCYGSGILVKEEKNNYYIVGIQNTSQRKDFIILNEKTRNMINQWSQLIQINLNNHIEIGAEGSKYLSQNNWKQLTKINLGQNNIDAQACKYLSQGNWPLLTTISLYRNNIDEQASKYLSQTNWINLTNIGLWQNRIGAQVCNYLSQANWPHLKQISLQYNQIDVQGCNYLSQANWTQLKQIRLYRNNIDAQGCKYLSRSNWIHLTNINLGDNNIGAQGCKYLSQADWAQLNAIYLRQNNIGIQGCKYLSQANWPHLTSINLCRNNIGAQGCKYLSQTNWEYLDEIDLFYNNIKKDIISRLLLEQCWPNTEIQYD